MKLDRVNHRSNVQSIIRTAAVVSGVAVLSACGSAAATQAPTTNAPSTTSTTQTSVAAAGAQYLRLVAPVNSATNTFNTTASTWNSSTTASEVAAAAAPLDATYQTLQAQLIASA